MVSDESRLAARAGNGKIRIIKGLIIELTRPKSVSVSVSVSVSEEKTSSFTDTHTHTDTVSGDGDVVIIMRPLITRILFRN